VSEGTKIGYLPFLDGLRAIAVGMIVIFHYQASGTEIMRGGFIGVDIFFVISGFLITLLLLEEWNGQGTIDLRQFWLRRARRLFPALTALLLVLITISFLCPALKERLDHSGPGISCYLPYLDGELAVIKSQILSAIFYVTNWYFICHGGSYFELANRPSLLTHLWSLAIEEQFYLIWPVLITVLLRVFRKKKGFLVLSVTALLLLSVVMMTIKGKAAPLDARAYYGTDCRAYALLLGALVAIFWKSWSWKNAPDTFQRIAVDLLGFSGLAILGCAGWTLHGDSLFIFHGGLFLASAGTVMIIIAGLSNSSSVSRVLSWKVLGWIGKRSYGLYIWHWPIFILTDPAYTYPLASWPLLALRTVLLLGAVQISHKYIEQPVHDGAIRRMIEMIKDKHNRNRKFFWRLGTGSALALAVIVFCFAAVVTAQPDRGPFGDRSASMTSSGSENQVTGLEETPSANVETPSLESKPATLSLELTEEKTETGRNVPKDDDEEEVVDRRATESRLAIGDSVMLGAKGALESEIAGIKVNAKVGRQFDKMLGIVRSLKAKNKLPDQIVIHGGTNGTIDEQKFEELMDLVKDCKRVVILNLCVPRPWQRQNNEIIDRIVAEYENTRLVDWHKECLSHRQFIYKDGIHLKNGNGAIFYASLVKKALAN